MNNVCKKVLVCGAILVSLNSFSIAASQVELDAKKTPETLVFELESRTPLDYDLSAISKICLQDKGQDGYIFIRSKGVIVQMLNDKGQGIKCKLKQKELPFVKVR